MAYDYIDSTGVIVADTSDILTEVQTEYKTAFGQSLIVTPDTPQGVLITAETLSRAGFQNNNAAIANQINPNISGGPFLDALMGLTGIQRIPATRTVAQGVGLTGVANTLIPAGSQAKTQAGDIFYTLSAVIIDNTGNATVDFASNDFGPVPCAALALNMIVINIPGWETVSNSVAAVQGQNTQSDVGARSYRNNTLGFQGVALPVAITSALYATDGVQSLSFLENVAATTQTISGISMVAHSIYVCVYGGADVDVAAALLENKSSGAAWNGGTTVNVVEPASGQTYAVQFDRPTLVPIVVKVTTTNGDPDNIKTAIMAYVNGQINADPGFTVGSAVSPWELAGAINILYPGTFLTKVEISLASSISYSTNVISMAVNQIATLTASNITVVVTG